MSYVGIKCLKAYNKKHKDKLQIILSPDIEITDYSTMNTKLINDNINEHQRNQYDAL